MAYDPSNPNKYQKQAGEYSASVSSVNSELEVALGELNQVNEILGFSSTDDTSLSKDVLTLNVITGNEEIKSEINALKSDLGIYTGIISTKAKDFDAEEKAEYDRMMALKKKKEDEENNKNKEEPQ